ncbi:Small Nuclear ribonucleoprotein splicing factor [Ceraceosorus bombacis]|uniref:U6 snRNA-associated Sm-like protein LSm1 n=1 Tax=Ceraceosorus bombacis TaxID=401625 RepID=A0A0P1B8J7_9BASI|nr:Small Nuclear ribonucleoprotein splicing factor [Ceraceosorus bombacis]
MDAESILSHVAFTTSGSIVDCIDKKVLIILRDGRKLIGVFRSFDQFANLVLQDAVERVSVGNRYGDIPRGLFLVRGENVVMLGEIDLDAEDIPNPAAVPLPPSALPQLLEAHKAEAAARKVVDNKKSEVLRRERGFCAEGAEGDGY